MANTVITPYKHALTIMGWTFETLSSTKKDYINRILQESFSPPNPCTLLDHAIRGNRLWVLAKPKDQPPFIILFLLEKCNGCWGYKDMDETTGPFYYDCPLRFLDQSPEPTDVRHSHGDSGRTWRDHVREHHAASKLRRQQRPKVGDVIVLPTDHYSASWAGTYMVTEDLGRKGLRLSARDGNHRSVRLPCNQIKHARQA
jgi:hypothetical protein